MQTLILLPLREVGLHMREIVIISVYFFNTSPPLFTFFIPLRTCTGCTVWPIFVVHGSKDVFSRHLCPFCGANKIFFIFSTIFSQFYIRMEHGLDLVDMT